MERGQASIEWLGAVTLVALVLGVGAGLAGGDAIAASVVRGMHRALCVVRGGVCDLDRRPCTLEANATEDDAHVNLGVFRIGRTELILREHRSDGTVLVTYLHETSGGWDVGVGADLWVSAAGHQLMAGSAARAALLTSIGGGESWLFDDALDADVGMAQLGEGHAPTLGRRVERFGGAGLELSAGAQTRLDGTVGAVGLGERAVQGMLVDERTGDRTIVVRREAGGHALIARRGDEASGAAEVREDLGVTFSSDGRPLELSIVRTGELRQALDVPDIAQPVADQLLGARGARHRRWVVEQRLDLTDPANLAAASRLLDALDGPVPMVARAGEELEARIAEAGVTEARSYGVDQESGGVGGHAAAGIKLGGAISDEAEQARLLGARILGPDGLWRDDRACEVA